MINALTKSQYGISKATINSCFIHIRHLQFTNARNLKTLNTEHVIEILFIV